MFNLGVQLAVAILGCDCHAIGHLRISPMLFERQSRWLAGALSYEESEICSIDDECVWEYITASEHFQSIPSLISKSMQPSHILLKPSILIFHHPCLSHFFNHRLIASMQHTDILAQNIVLRQPQISTDSVLAGGCFTRKEKE